MPSWLRGRSSSHAFVAGLVSGTTLGILFACTAAAVLSYYGPSSTDPVIAAATPSIGTASPTPDLRPRTKAGLEVRLGPGLPYDVVGLVPRGAAVDVIGRDAESAWLAISFPPGSASRGWVAVDELDGLRGIDNFAVAMPTPLPRSLTVQPPSNSSAAKVPTSVPRFVPTPVPTPITIPAASATVTSVRQDRVDLAILGLSLLSEGRVSVVVVNRGRDAMTNQTIFVVVRDLALRSEQLSLMVASLGPGATVNLQTQSFRVLLETTVQAIVDPYASTRDEDRSNNSMSISLRP